jgi:hypothetical protein
LRQLLLAAIQQPINGGQLGVLDVLLKPEFM